MTRASFAWALCAALAACVKSTSLQKFVVLDPVFDSVFVGRQKPLPRVIYFDGDQVQTPPASAVTWQSSDPTILAVNNPSGQIKGLKRGTAFVSATVENTQGSEIVTVPDSVDITLLVDTLYLLPGDTMTIPTIILHRDNPPVVTYDATGATIFTIDANSGRVTATATPGGPETYRVHADDASDSGAVYVLDPMSVGAGKAFFTVLGPSVIGAGVSHLEASPKVISYSLTDRSPAFRVQATHAPATSSEQVAQVTVPAAVAVGVVASAIDSITPVDSSACAPPEAWAIWSTPTSTAYSGNGHPGQQILITQLVTLTTGGQVVGGRFAYRARRGEFYTRPASLLTITGVFVAPLTTAIMCP
jgi:hypothetical protein